MNGTILRHGCLLVVVLVAGLLAGCNNTTLLLPSGGSVSGKLHHADSGHIYIELEPPADAEEAADRHAYLELEATPTEANDDDKRTFRVLRSNVVDVDYPGDALIAVGASVLVPSLIVAAAGVGLFASCGGEGLCGFFLLLMTTPGAGGIVAGAIPLGIGVSRKNTAIDIVEGSSTTTGWSVQPVFVPGQEETTAGLTTQLTW